jgi:hypothetical protein
LNDIKQVVNPISNQKLEMGFTTKRLFEKIHKMIIKINYLKKDRMTTKFEFDSGDIENFMYKIMINFVTGKYDHRNYDSDEKDDEFLESFERIGFQRTIEKYASNFVVAFNQFDHNISFESDDDTREYKSELFQLFVDEIKFVGINNLHGDSKDEIKDEFFEVLSLGYNFFHN